MTYIPLYVYGSKTPFLLHIQIFTKTRDKPKTIKSIQNQKVFKYLFLFT